MRVWLAAVIALSSFGIARGAKSIAMALEQDHLSEPYAPSPGAAPYISLGYHETMADLLFVRLRGYFGDPEYRPETVAELCEALITVDPKFQRAYEYCGLAMTYPKEPVPQSIFLRAIALLERGTKEFPRDWRIPNLAGQIYTQDLKTDDPAQRRAWDERGTRLIESAVRKPEAPVALQAYVSVMRTKFGQREKAIQGLREMLLVTTQTKSRRALIEQLAKLQSQDADEIAGELYEARLRFWNDWQSHRPAVPATWYVLLGPHLRDDFDMASLATGGHDLVMLTPAEPLDPL